MDLINEEKNLDYHQELLLNQALFSGLSHSKNAFFSPAMLPVNHCMPQEHLQLQSMHGMSKIFSKYPRVSIKKNPALNSA